MAEIKSCPVCQSPSEHRFDGRLLISCPRCGEYRIGRISTYSLQEFSPSQIANLSGWIREHQDSLLVGEDLARLSQLRTPTVGEKSDKLLLFLSRNHPKPGEWISLDEHSKPLPGKASYGRDLYGVCWCQDQEEFVYVLHTYLRDEKKFIRVENPDVGAKFTIAPAGWSHLHSLAQGNSNSEIGFIAMWFDESMKAAWMAMEDGIRAAGYRPFRVDQKEHNNDITDEIIAGIRGSKFLVADLTRHRNGAYYEAGFAKGLGLEVVWLCRKSDEKDRHFDIRQLSTIFWEEDKLPELTKALTNRIVASSIGRGPLEPAT